MRHMSSGTVGGKLGASGLRGGRGTPRPRLVADVQGQLAGAEFEARGASDESKDSDAGRCS
jgi:hypothetical protein